MVMSSYQKRLTKVRFPRKAVQEAAIRLMVDLCLPEASTTEKARARRLLRMRLAAQRYGRFTNGKN